MITPNIRKNKHVPNHQPDCYVGLLWLYDCSCSTSIQLALRLTNATCRHHAGCALWSSVVYHCWSLQKHWEENLRVPSWGISYTLLGFMWFDLIIEILRAYCRNNFKFNVVTPRNGKIGKLTSGSKSGAPNQMIPGIQKWSHGFESMPISHFGPRETFNKYKQCHSCFGAVIKW